jgi:hypothetical protein
MIDPKLQAAMDDMFEATNVARSALGRVAALYAELAPADNKLEIEEWLVKALDRLHYFHEGAERLGDALRREEAK